MGNEASVAIARANAATGLGLSLSIEGQAWAQFIEGRLGESIDDAANVRDGDCRDARAPTRLGPLETHFMEYQPGFYS